MKCQRAVERDLPWYMRESDARPSKMSVCIFVHSLCRGRAQTGISAAALFALSVWPALVQIDNHANPTCFRIIGLINWPRAVWISTCCMRVPPRARQRFLTASMNNCPTCGGAVEIWHFDCDALHHNLPIYCAHASCCRFFWGEICSLSVRPCTLCSAPSVPRHNLFWPVDMLAGALDIKAAICQRATTFLRQQARIFMVKYFST